MGSDLEGGTGGGSYVPACLRSGWFPRSSKLSKLALTREIGQVKKCERHNKNKHDYNMVKEIVSRSHIRPLSPAKLIEKI
jgi:hypothetical protein